MKKADVIEAMLALDEKENQNAEPAAAEKNTAAPKSGQSHKTEAAGHKTENVQSRKAAGGEARKTEGTKSHKAAAETKKAENAQSVKADTAEPAGAEAAEGRGTEAAERRGESRRTEAVERRAESREVRKTDGIQTEGAPAHRSQAVIVRNGSAASVSAVRGAERKPVRRFVQTQGTASQNHTQGLNHTQHHSQQTAGECPSAGRYHQIIGAGQTGDAVQKDHHVPLMLHKTLCPLDHHFRNSLMMLRKLVKGGIDHFRRGRV